MTRADERVEVYVEAGRKRAFAGALDWPGWCRAGRDEAAALQALAAYAPRYGRALAAAGMAFPAPGTVTDLAVAERLNGTMTTDFGAPDVAPACDARPVDAAELARLTALLRAAWRALDQAAAAAAGQTLRPGPRGGGRGDQDSIVAHVLNAEAAYLSRLGGKWKMPAGAEVNRGRAWDELRAAVETTLGAAARGEVPARGPRGGARWSARYFVRRAAWHALDHAWEIEDRMDLTPGPFP